MIGKYVMLSFKEAGSFAGATAMSCGPSQAFGSIKFLIDVILLAKHSALDVQARTNLCQLNQKGLHKCPKIKKIVNKRLKIASVDEGIIISYLESKIRKKDDRVKKLLRSVIADVAAMIPLVGAHVSWRIATEYNGYSFRPFVAHSLQQALEHQEALLSKLLFQYSVGRKANSGDVKNAVGVYRERISIPVETSTKHRSIEAFHYKQGFWSSDSKHTVVLSHGNMETAIGRDKIAKKYVKKGYNVLSFTIGGYGQSRGCRSSEGHVYQDVEAVKLFLKDKGVRGAAYHGVSLGGGAAFFGGVRSEENLKTLFVVADQTFTTAKNAAGNTTGNLFPPLKAVARGLFSAGIPSDQLIELPGPIKRWVRTDGFNNAAKAKALKEQNIPVYCVLSTKDFLMGWNKKQKEYRNNFAFELATVDPINKGRLITIQGKHGASLNDEALMAIPHANSF